MTSLTKCLYSGAFGRGNSSSGCEPNLCWRHRRSEPPTHINKGENTEPVTINGKHLTICAGQNVENMVRIDWPLFFFLSMFSFLYFCPSLFLLLHFFSPFPLSPPSCQITLILSVLKLRGKVTLCLHLVCWWSDMPSLVTCCAARFDIWKRKNTQYKLEVISPTPYCKWLVTLEQWTTLDQSERPCVVYTSCDVILQLFVELGERCCHHPSSAPSFSLLSCSVFRSSNRIHILILCFHKGEVIVGQRQEWTTEADFEP